MTPETSNQMRERYEWHLKGIVESSGILRRIAIRPLPFRVGRSPYMHFALMDPSVSKIHAEITDDGDALVITDLGSTNGTYVNYAGIVKPTCLKAGDIVSFANREFRVTHDSMAQAAEPGTTNVSRKKKRPGLVSNIGAFREMLKLGAVVPHFQPLVRLDDDSTFGFELLGRGGQSGLAKLPRDLFNIAVGLGHEAELSRLFRAKGGEAFSELPVGTTIFLNIHPAEMRDTTTLIESIRNLRRICLDRSLAVEIHEGVVSNVEEIRLIRNALRELGVGLAYDDFGSGQARLLELVEVPPDYLKFDKKLVQGLHKATSRKRKIVRMLLEFVLNEGIRPVAEGVECAEDAAACRELGFYAAQGFHFGRPFCVGEHAHPTPATGIRHEEKVPALPE